MSWLRYNSQLAARKLFSENGIAVEARGKYSGNCVCVKGLLYFYYICAFLRTPAISGCTLCCSQVWAF